MQCNLTIWENKNAENKKEKYNGIDSMIYIIFRQLVFPKIKAQNLTHKTLMKAMFTLLQVLFAVFQCFDFTTSERKYSYLVRAI